MLLKVQVIVSVPRAGEFIVTVPIESTDVMKDSQVFAEDLAIACHEAVLEKLKVRVVPGELERVRKRVKTD